MINIYTKCEQCPNQVLLTYIYNGEPILCEDCLHKGIARLAYIEDNL